ncbi:MAG: hypothetical protein IJ062_00210 [Firmicutes bacterium]|nr:hypothetical protein [Bacillota bacterium]
MKILKILGVILTAIILLISAVFILPDVKYQRARDNAVSAISNSDRVELIITDDDHTVRTVEVSDKADVDKLKQLCCKITGYNFFNDGDLSCGYYERYAVKFINTTDNSETLVCPACDGCGSMQIGEMEFYINHDTTRKEFDKTVKKYGMDFPWV